LQIDGHADIARLPGFAKGHFSVQDGAAQCAADLMDLHEGMRVLDACAAPGGKACHMLEHAELELLALEREPARASSIRSNLERLHLACELRNGDAGNPGAWWDRKPFDRILLDAPCSATGVIRRHPDIKLHRRASDIPQLAREQARLLEASWPLLARHGLLVYATCSVLHEENERVAAGFLDAHPDAQPERCDLPVGRAAGAGWQILPGEGGLDGMYYAVIAKA
jgi:16S rRNA (cytosine967-C5)-methyltransferase